MNIFVLDEDPVLAAKMQCDKHVVKMCTETAQLLSNALPPGLGGYSRTHHNHPCSIWTRLARDNFDWLVRHGSALSAEYTNRYGRIHAAGRIIQNCANQSHLVVAGPMTPFVQCVPDEFKGPDPVEAYRLFYVFVKSRFAVWRFPHAPAPSWYQQGVSWLKNQSDSIRS